MVRKLDRTEQNTTESVRKMRDVEFTRKRKVKTTRILDLVRQHEA